MACDTHRIMTARVVLGASSVAATQEWRGGGASFLIPPPQVGVRVLVTVPLAWLSAEEPE